MKESNETDFAETMGESGSAIKTIQSKSVRNNTVGDPPDNDIYVLLQGPAHIKSLNSTGAGIEVTFLDDTGKPTKTPIEFTFDPDPEKDFSALKIVDLQLLIECDKTELEKLKQNDKLKDYFPKLYKEIDKTEGNIPSMNPPDPPFKK